MPKRDDSKQALELLVLGREYLVDVFALALLRAEQAKTAEQGFVTNTVAGGIRVLTESIEAREQAIIAAAKEHFSGEHSDRTPR